MSATKWHKPWSPRLNGFLSNSVAARAISRLLTADFSDAIGLLTSCLWQETGSEHVALSSDTSTTQRSQFGPGKLLPVDASDVCALRFGAVTRACKNAPFRINTPTSHGHVQAPICHRANIKTFSCRVTCPLQNGTNLGRHA